MSLPDPLHDPDNVLPEDFEQEEDLSPADHWEKIVEITSLIKAQVADLEDMLRDFNKSAL